MINTYNSNISSDDYNRGKSMNIDEIVDNVTIKRIDHQNSNSNLSQGIKSLENKNSFSNIGVKLSSNMSADSNAQFKVVTDTNPKKIYEKEFSKHLHQMRHNVNNNNDINSLKGDNISI
jgi:hypothetical protein